MIIDKFKWWLLAWVTHAIYHHGFQSRALLRINQTAYHRYELAAMAREDWLR